MHNSGNKTARNSKVKHSRPNKSFKVPKSHFTVPAVSKRKFTVRIKGNVRLWPITVVNKWPVFGHIYPVSQPLRPAGVVSGLDRA